MDLLGVRGLRVEQAADWDARSADDTDGWDYWPRPGGGRADLVFRVADSEVALSCVGVRLRLVAPVRVPDVPSWVAGPS